MTCRHCRDTYKPSETPRQRATLNGVTSRTLLALGTERGNWINLSDPLDLREFVERVDAQASVLESAAANIRNAFGTDFNMFGETAAEMENHAVDMRADITQYVKMVRDVYETHRGMYRACRKAQRMQKVGK